MEYDPRQYWTTVAEHVRRRPPGAALAGDDTPYQRYNRAKFLRTLLPKVDVRVRRVLEVGSGPGGNLRALQAVGPALLVGCDFAEEMVTVARESLDQESVAQRLVVCDGGALPFRSGAFDLSYTVTVLQHNDDVRMEEMVSELCRVSTEEVCVFEDAGTRLYRDQSYTVRAVTQYVDCFERRGFSLAAVEPLRTGFSFRLGSAIRRLFRSRNYVEGAPAPRLLRLAEAATLPASRALDTVVPQRAGLVRMAFSRRGFPSEDPTAGP